jgi:hypothetical protein
VVFSHTSKKFILPVYSTSLFYQFILTVYSNSLFYQFILPVYRVFYQQNTTLKSELNGQFFFRFPGSITLHQILHPGLLLPACYLIYWRLISAIPCNAEMEFGRRYRIWREKRKKKKERKKYDQLFQ